MTDPKPTLPLSLRLRAARHSRGLSQVAAADLLGISWRQYIRYEREQAHNPSARLAAAMREHLGVEVPEDSAKTDDTRITRLERQVKILERDIRILEEALERSALQG